MLDRCLSPTHGRFKLGENAYWTFLQTAKRQTERKADCKDIKQLNNYCIQHHHVLTKSGDTGDAAS